MSTKQTTFHDLQRTVTIEAHHSDNYNKDTVIPTGPDPADYVEDGVIPTTGRETNNRDDTPATPTTTNNPDDPDDDGHSGTGPDPADYVISTQ